VTYGGYAATDDRECAGIPAPDLTNGAALAIRAARSDGFMVSAKTIASIAIGLDGGTLAPTSSNKTRSIR